MRIQLVSDLHLEFLSARWPGERLVTPAPGAAVLVLAGDVALGTSAIELFADWPVPVVYVLGNHEFYARTWPDVIESAKTAAEGTSIHVLERESIEIGGVRFVGATFWTDYLLSGPNLQPFLMRRAKAGLSDHKLILKRDGHLFSPLDALADHQQSRDWLEEELAQPFEGRVTVVVTHHGPLARSIHPRFTNSDMNGSFVSDLPSLVEKSEVWIHGHVHNSFDYYVGGCRVLANPRGYPLNMQSADTPKRLLFENTEFDVHFTIDV